MPTESEYRFRELQKKRLIERVESLSIDEKSSLKEFSDASRKLLNEWKEVGHAGEVESALWRQFKAARDELYDALGAEHRRREEAYRNRERESGKNAQSKRYLIGKIRSLSVTSGENLKALSVQGKSLFDEWRDIWHAGDDEEHLWNQFKSHRQDLIENIGREWHRRQDAY
ncbi:MAG: hypothetical protein A6F71_10520 [Cycloclasticus sp. symbiont of Poecilosclerida sp. M]|nr:MAG: hypothetical protein A6F71_10520 [Cycloclasticus sp. symbiont of Poecilosclerida sp. M]